MYDDFITINDKFKSAVNLEYDLYNKDKILQYIPTTDLCDVIKMYIKSVLGYPEKHSTFLSGPYGKGKSYLMLMITYFLSKREDKELLGIVLNKFSKIDEDLVGLVKELENKKISLLPIIINNNSFNDMNQNYLLAVGNALRNHKIYDVLPQSTYSECLKTIKIWETVNKENLDVFDKCVNELDVTLEELKKGLSLFKYKYYEKFLQLHTCITHGTSFNPLVSNDISSVYSDVAMKLKSHNYSGIFIISDEFGVFLENHTKDFAERLNKIQSLAEKCEQESDYQMHFCCITHKEITLYNKDKKLSDSFVKIAGRFKQIRFDRSIEENYQIICSALNKTKEYNQLVSTIQTKYKELFNNLKDNNVFTEKQLDYVINNGIPFNPIALFSLIQISEIVAQNERTLFTFLSDDGNSTFKYFIANNEKELLNVNNIYDYFEELIKENDEYKSIYYKVKSSCKLCPKKEQQDIIKVIAVIKLINDPLRLNCSIESIAMSLGKITNDIKELVDTLLNKNILKQNINDNSIDFSVMSDKSVYDLMENLTKSRNNFHLSKSLNKFYDKKYLISNQYNFEFKMVRFYKEVFIDSSDFKELNDITNIIPSNTDGIVLNISNNDSSSLKSIQETLETLNASNVIVRYVKNKIDIKIEKQIKLLESAEEVLTSKNKLDENTINLLPVLIADISKEITNYLEKLYNSSILLLNGNKEENINEVLYKSLTNTYTNTVVLNHELVNRNNVSSVITKARNNIIDSLLDENDTVFSSTSAEGTINYAFTKSLENNNNIVEMIANNLKESNSGKVHFKSLVGKLKSKPYGIREGVITLYLAKAITTINSKSLSEFNTLVIYNKDKDIIVNSNNLTKIVNNPNDYYFSFKSINSKNIKMLNDMCIHFNINSTISLSKKVQSIIDVLKRKVINIEPIIISCTKRDNIIHLSDEALSFKNEFMKADLNAFDLIFDELPRALNVKVTEMSNKIISILKEFEDKLIEYSNRITKELCAEFNPKYNGNLKSTIDIWLKDNSQVSNIVFDDKYKSLYKSMTNIEHNNIDAINSLSAGALNCNLSDWNSKKENNFKNIIKEFINIVINYDKDLSINKNDIENSTSNVEMSTLGKTLYNNILEEIEDYGDALSNEEKAMIIKNVLNKIIN
ncbi:MAG: hypothetical protein R3Y60_04970 [bacterium]